MIEPMRTMSNRDADLATYQPLAVMSVVAFVASCLFVGLVAILTLVGLITRKPVLEAWLIGSAIVGVLLSIAARWQIRISEGTRAGQKLASWALWLSVLGGCIYAAYYAGSIMSIQAQANAFVKDVWLNAVKEKDYDNIFLFTLDPVKRIGMNMRDMKARFGDVTRPVHSNTLVRTIIKADGKVSFEPKGTIKWQSTQEGFEVTTEYVIETPEGRFDVIIPAVGSDHKDMEGRQWQIKLPKVGLRALGITPYGRLISNLEYDGREFLGSWTQMKLVPFRQAEAYLDVVPGSREERRQQYREYLSRGLIGNWLASVTEPARGLSVAANYAVDLCVAPYFGEIYFPKMIETTRGLIHWDESKQARQAKYKEKQAEHLLSIGAVQLAEPLVGDNPATPKIEVVGKEIRASIAIKIHLPPYAGVPEWRCRGIAVATLDDPQLAAELTRLQNLPWQGHAELEPPRDTKPTLTKYNWRISAVNIDLARDMTDERPGGGTPGMMPAGAGGPASPFGP